MTTPAAHQVIRTPSHTVAELESHLRHMHGNIGIPWTGEKWLPTTDVVEIARRVRLVRSSGLVITNERDRTLLEFGDRLVEEFGQ